MYLWLESWGFRIPEYYNIYILGKVPTWSLNWNRWKCSIYSYSTAHLLKGNVIRILYFVPIACRKNKTNPAEARVFHTDIPLIQLESKQNHGVSVLSVGALAKSFTRLAMIAVASKKMWAQRFQSWLDWFSFVGFSGVLDGKVSHDDWNQGLQQLRHGLGVKLFFSKPNLGKAAGDFSGWWSRFFGKEFFASADVAPTWQN